MSENNLLRDQFAHRPLLSLAIGLVLGIAAITQLAACLLLLLFFVLIRQVRASVIAAVGFAIGAIIAPTGVSGLEKPAWIDGTATVLTVPRLYPTESRCVVRVGATTLTASLPRNAGLVLRDQVHLRGVAKPLPEGSERLLDRGIVGSIRPVSMRIEGRGPWIFWVGVAWRDSFAAFCERWLPAEAAAAAEAVCFNVDTSLDAETRDALSRSGTVHIVSASGLHVGILAVALLWLLSKAPIPRHWQLACLAFFLCVYAVASGLHPPVIRASFMAIVLSAAYLFRREPDLLSALAFAAVATILWDPASVRDPGFQLSFTVVAAFAIFRSHRNTAGLRGVERSWTAARSNLRQSALATAAAAPLVVYSFGTLSLTSVVANLLIAFALPVLVVAAMGAHLLSVVLPSVAAGIMVLVVGPLAGWLFFVTDSLGKPWAAVTVPGFSGYWLLLAYGLMLSVWSVRLRPA